MVNWISAVKKELGKPLPGIQAQMRMAPSRLRSPQKPIPMRDSGVLLLLYPVKNSWYTVFIKRPEYDGLHSGQISFPGGKFEPGDESLIDTALRESREEIGISLDAVEVLGKLSPLHIPISNFQVLPVVGCLPEKPLFKTDPQEVDYIIETRLDILLNPETAKIKTIQFDDVSIEVPYFEIDSHHIWGATAMILSEFLEVLGRIE
jgi:8-oxo-dGTP pyrophosphatase MutT (NUDIX family)